MSGKTDEDAEFESEMLGTQTDFNGSAKVALIAAERSLAAWVKLSEWLPDSRDEALPMMALLQKIIAEGDREFPDARLFKRPGFDGEVDIQGRRDGLPF